MRESSRRRKGKRGEGNRNSARDKTSQTIVIQWSEKREEYAGRKRAIQGIERKMNRKGGRGRTATARKKGERKSDEIGNTSETEDKTRSKE